MKNYRSTTMLAAIAAGVVTGAYMGTRRPRKPPSRALVALASPSPLAPVPIAPSIVPVIYDAHFEEPSRAHRLPWCLAVLAIIALLVWGGLSTRPRIQALAAPRTVLAGSPATISYATSGYGSAHLSIVDGAPPSSQTLERNGAITLPTTPRSTRIVALLQVRSFLGSDERVIAIRVIPMPRPIVRMQGSDAPVITDFRLSSASARGGQTITASFRTNATGGNVRLVDSQGAVWLSRPIQANGAVQLAVPVMHRDTPFIAVLHAERKNQSIEASAGFIAQAKASALKESQPMTEFFRQPSFAIPAVVHAGTAFSIGIPPPISGVSVALSSKDGAGLSEPATQDGDHVRVYAPMVRTAQQTFASLTFQNGKERETVIRRILIVP